MNDDSLTVLDAGDTEFPAFEDRYGAPPIPAYCEETYWWAYLHPRSVWFFERPWVVNLILWGHMNRLTDAVLEEIGSAPGKVLQVACVYGSFSHRLANHVHRSGGRFHLVDVAPIQLRNARRKLAEEPVTYHHQDSTRLRFTDGHFENTVVFFLLHEQPASARRETIAEALRVTRPGGKVIFVDYHRPHRLNPLRYLMQPVLKTLEPFALDLWRRELPEWLPDEVPAGRVRTSLYGGGLYQRMVIRR